MTGLYDVIFLMTKQQRNKETVEFLMPYLSANGVIVTTQNGLPEDSVAEVAGKERVLGCAISWGATLVGDGEAKLTSSPQKLEFALGSPYIENHHALDGVNELLSRMGKVTIEANFVGARWAKLAVNSAFSSLSALTGLSFGKIAKQRTTRKVAQLLLKEVFDVVEKNDIAMGRVQGYNIHKIYNYHTKFKKAISFMLLPYAMKNHKDIYSGMLYDLQKGKPCDIDYINGVVVEYGKKVGYPTPLNEKVVSLIHQIEAGTLTVSATNIKLVLEK
jgi:2-dehydropantoate 2-reductase